VIFSGVQPVMLVYMIYVTPIIRYIYHKLGHHFVRVVFVFVFFRERNGKNVALKLLDKGPIICMLCSPMAHRTNYIYIVLSTTKHVVNLIISI
jgi:hypothetical protein